METLIETQMEISTLNKISAENQTRYSTGINYLDTILGGGLVTGETILFAGLPGAGKSTFLLQMAYHLSVAKQKRVLYINGEESKESIKSRANRLCIDSNKIFLYDETKVEEIIKATNMVAPDIIIVDSIQMLSSTSLRTASGTPSQTRMSLLLLCALAKKKNITIFFVGHSTKGGYIAGLQTLQHMVDAVFFLGVNDDMTRSLKTSKNRYGETLITQDLYMTKYGLTDNPYQNKPDSIIQNIPYTEKQIKVAIEGTFMKPLVLASITWLKEKSGNTKTKKGFILEGSQIQQILKENPNFLVRHSLNWLENYLKEVKV